MQIVKINKKYKGKIEPYYTYLPYTFKYNDKKIDANIRVLVESEITDGVLEYQKYKIVDIDMFEKIYEVNDYKISNINEDSINIDEINLIESIYKMLKENEKTFLYKS